MNIIEALTDGYSHAYSLATLAYGSAIASNAEKMYILESGNYKSDIFNATLGAGAEAVNTTYPYGWDTYSSLWLKPWLKPTGLYPVGSLNYLIFPTFTAGVIFLCNFLQNNGNNPGAWNSTDPATQQNYNASIAGIKNAYV